MEYKTYLYNGLSVKIVSGPITNIRLLQGSYGPISKLVSNEGTVDAITNCSYFTTGYVLGRNQGDMSQETSSYSSQNYLGVAIKSDGSYVAGELEFWDGVDDIVAGFTPAAITYLYGQYTELFSSALGYKAYSNKLALKTGVTMFGILADKKTALLITAASGISGYNLITFLTNNLGYNFDLLCSLDGGGSTEMIVNKTIVQASTDSGTNERKMYNGLAFITPKPKVDEIINKKSNMPFLERLTWEGMTDNYTVKTTSPVTTGSKYYYDVKYDRFAQGILYLPNCTCYAAGRAAEIADAPLGTEMPGGNAKTWWTTTTWQKGSEPKVGAICVWGSNSVQYGHVAVVERVNEDGSVLISQSNYTRSSASSMNNNYFQTKTHKLTVGQKGTLSSPFLGYIYNPYINDIRVARDENKSQVEIITYKIKARKKPGLEAETYKGLYMPKGIYDILETEIKDDYLWIKVAEDLWFASNDKGGWTATHLLDNKKEEEIEPPVSDINEIYLENLKSQISILTKENEDLRVNIQKLQNDLIEVNNNLSNESKKSKDTLLKIKKIVDEALK